MLRQKERRAGWWERREAHDFEIMACMPRMMAGHLTTLLDDFSAIDYYVTCHNHRHCSCWREGHRAA